MKHTLLLLIIIIAQQLCAQVPAPGDKPNVILIVLDDMNDYMSALGGHPQVETPNMDRLAAEGMLFTNAYCNTTQCSPSRTSFMSGKNLEYTQVYTATQYYKPVFRDNFTAAKGNEVVFTLPEILKDTGGYYTKQINKIFHGRNFFTNQDIDFDSVELDPCSKAKSWNEVTNLANGPAEPEPNGIFDQGFTNYAWGAIPDADESKMQDYRGVDSAIQFLLQHNNNPGLYCDKPFFLALGIYHPHHPLHAPERYFPPFYNPDYDQLPYNIPFTYPENNYPRTGLIMPPQADPIFADFSALSPIGKTTATKNNSIEAQFQNFIDNIDTLPQFRDGMTLAQREFVQERAHKANSVLGYIASVRFADEQVGRVLDYLDAFPAVKNNTVVVLVSDHGFALGEKKHWKKQGLWETDIRVPMVIYDPRRTGGKTCNRVVSLLDLFPTVLDLTSVNEPSFPDGSRYLDGESLLPLLDNPNREWNSAALSAMQIKAGSSLDGGCFPHYSVRDERWHYIRYNTNGGADLSCDPPNSQIEEELYEIGTNRDVDPDELNNLAADPAYQGVKDYLSQWLPGGPLYNGRAGAASIAHDTLPCSVDLTSVTNFQAEYRDEDGFLVSPLPAGWTATWSSTDFTTDYVGETLPLSDALLSGVAPEFLTITLTVSDGSLVYSDLLTLFTGTVNPADVAFNAVPLDPLTIDVINYNPPNIISEASWDYGDGLTNNEMIPLSHIYSMPGTFTITGTSFYGNDERNQCPVTHSEIVTIDTAAFGPLTCQINNAVSVEFITSTTAEISWSPTYQAEKYVVHYNENFIAGTLPDLSVETTNTDVVLTGLKPNTAYQFYIRAVCDEAAGINSFATTWFYFATENCEPPREISIGTVTDTEATIHWVEPLNNSLVYQLGYKVPGFPLNLANIPGGNTVTLTGLVPDKNYFFKMRTVCPDENDVPKYPSGLSELYGFSTLTTSARMEALLNSLSIQPNPAQSYTDLQFDIEGSLHLRVFDIAGKLVMEHQLGEAQQYRLETSDLNAGLYHLHVTNGTQTQTGKLAIAR